MHQGAARRLALHGKAFILTCAIFFAGYLAYVIGGATSVAQTSGTLFEHGLNASVQIVRDSRGVPHVLASTQHDLFFAQGYAEGSDRLVQMDLVRRFVYGRIAEIVGPIQLNSDIDMRYLDVRDIVDRQWKHLSDGDRTALQAFSDGVNAAMQQQPLPFEFRFFLYSPDAWSPKDCLAVTMALSASLDDPASNVVARDALWHKLTPRQFDEALPLSDAAYDVAPDGRRIAATQTQSIAAPKISHALASHAKLRRSARGSNAWAAGASLTATHRALIANDPHLELTIPNIWYLIEMQAPGLHVAGATIPGIPGVVLGHNERLAWASTNAMTTPMSLYRVSKTQARYWRREIFHVRFSRDVERRYYRTPGEFGVPAVANSDIALARWTPYTSVRSPLSTVLQLDRAASVDQALAILSRYAGPAQNFVVADVDGRVAYHVAGAVMNDPAWGRYMHPASALGIAPQMVPYAALPAVAASRSALVLSANNKPYDLRYPYRLSAEFAPPYRAYRIAQLLHARNRYDAAYFARMQLDVISPADAELAHRAAAFAQQHPRLLSESAVAQLRSWNGSYDARSRVATMEYALRSNLQANALTPYAPFLMMRAPTPNAIPYALRDLANVNAPWGVAGAVQVLHPMGTSVLAFLNGTTLPGNGNENTIRMQTPGLAQSFRAVWDVGNWDAGGIVIPSGESGARGSMHYADESGDWVAGRLRPLAFSRPAVERTARALLTLQP